MYVYDGFGQMTAEYSTAANTSPCATCYLTWDHLGTPRMVTDQNGNVVARHDYIPSGEEIQAGSAGRGSMWGPQGDSVETKFTGQVRDSETGNDYFQARYYTSSFGRFMSPDPANAGADITNPQSWNAYAYVLGNPLGFVDPSGMTYSGIGDGQCPPRVFCVTRTELLPPSQYQAFNPGVNPNSGVPTGPGVAPGNSGGTSPAPGAIPPAKKDIVHILTCSVASVVGPLAAAQITKRVAGIGVAGSAGAGLLIGMGASLGIQLVADPHGNVGISLSGSISSILLGAGAAAGVQGTVTDATNINDLSGPSGGLDISAGAGPAVDLGIQGGSSPNWQKFVGPISLSATVGVGVGTKMAAFSFGGTKVWPITNCGTH